MWSELQNIVCAEVYACTLSIKFEASFYGYRCVNGNHFVTSYKPFKVQRHRGRMESMPWLNMWMHGLLLVSFCAS